LKNLKLAALSTQKNQPEIGTYIGCSRFALTRVARNPSMCGGAAVRCPGCSAAAATAAAATAAAAAARS
jgi:hypothetical protein